MGKIIRMIWTLGFYLMNKWFLFKLIIWLYLSKNVISLSPALKYSEASWNIEFTMLPYSVYEGKEDFHHSSYACNVATLVTLLVIEISS